MANYYIGLNKGQVLKDVAVNTSTNSVDIELNILSTNVTSKADVLQAVEFIVDKLIQSNWPPA